MKAFLSYVTAERAAAAEVAAVLAKLGVETFMAHENIRVSEQWQRSIIASLRSADLFVAMLSPRYIKSVYCLQEAGIAVYRRGLTIVPLAISDGLTSPGFMAHIQSRRITPGNIDHTVIYDGVAAKNATPVFDHLLEVLRSSGSFRAAEANYRDLEPYLSRMPDERKADVLRTAVENSQVGYAHLLVSEYLPPLFARYGALLSDQERASLQRIFDRNN